MRYGIELLDSYVSRMRYGIKLLDSYVSRMRHGIELLDFYVNRKWIASNSNKEGASLYN